MINSKENKGHPSSPLAEPRCLHCDSSATRLHDGTHFRKLADVCPAMDVPCRQEMKDMKKQKGQMGGSEEREGKCNTCHKDDA